MNVRQVISVALCTWNGADYLAEQIDSILMQTRLPDEIVVCDDFSNDETETIITQALEKGGTLGITCRLVRNQRTLGYVGNFAQAVSLCTGNWILLCDQDDVWLPKKVETLLRAMDTAQQTDIALIFTDAELVGPQLEPLGSLFSLRRLGNAELAEIRNGNALPRFFAASFVTGATLAVRTDFAHACLPFPPVAWSHDEWLALWALATKKILPVPSKTMLYRQHGGNLLGAAAGWKEKARMFKRRFALSLAAGHSLRLADKAKYLKAALASDLPETLGVTADSLGRLHDYAGWLVARSRACRDFDLAAMLRHSANPFQPSRSGWLAALALDLLEAASFRILARPNAPKRD